MRLQVESTTAPRTEGHAQMPCRASGNRLPVKATFSRTDTSAVLWLSPSMNRYILQRFPSAAVTSGATVCSQTVRASRLSPAARRSCIPAAQTAS